MDVRVETMIEPTVIYAGDTLTWSRTVADYPAPEWTLNYALVKAGKLYTFASTAEGSAHRVAVTSATTATWQAGDYTLTPYVTRSGERVTLPGAVRVTVKPNPLGAAVDPRSWALKTLEAVEAYLGDASNLTAATYQINGRSLSRIPLGELLRLRDTLKAEIAAEKKAEDIRAGLGTNSRIRVRFVK
jgi:hypothetical protein